MELETSSYVWEKSSSNVPPFRPETFISTSFAVFPLQSDPGTHLRYYPHRVSLNMSVDGSGLFRNSTCATRFVRHGSESHVCGDMVDIVIQASADLVITPTAFYDILLSSIHRLRVRVRVSYYYYYMVIIRPFCPQSLPKPQVISDSMYLIFVLTSPDV